MNKGRATNVIYLDFCKQAYDMVPHNILLYELRREDFDGWNIRYVRNFLDGYIQRAMSKWKSVTSAVP